MDLATLFESLEELARREIQEKFWIHGDESQMSTMEEAVCGVFDDADLTHAIESGYLKEQFSSRLDEKARELSKLVDRLPYDACPEDLIELPEMEKVRVVAGELLAFFKEETKE